MRLGVGFYLAALGLLATGHPRGALLCVVLGSLVIFRARQAKPAPRRAYEDVVDVKTGEITVSDHVWETGCLCTKEDFVDVTGLCPYGGTYDEHPE